MNILAPSSSSLLSEQALARVLASRSVFPPFAAFLRDDYARTIRCFVAESSERQALLHLKRLVGESQAATLLNQICASLEDRLADLLDDKAFHQLYEDDRYYVLLDHLAALLVDQEALPEQVA